MGDPKIDALKFWCDKIVNDPDIEPECLRCFKKVSAHGESKHKVEGPKTFCNIAVHRILQGAFNYNSFDGLLANEIIRICRGAWRVSAGDKQARFEAAQANADAGAAVILGREGKEHGHIAVVYPICRPAKMLFSGRWGIYCPIVANVGKKNEIGPANFYFNTTEEPPDVFILGDSIG